MTPPHRVIVIGTSGSGKTTLAARIAARLRIRHVEIDALFHGPNWVPRESFLEEVQRLADSDEWVTEWQYREARPVLLARATLAVWLDYPLRLRMWRNVTRTVRRRVRRVELWNGNFEPPLWTIFTNRDHIIRWAWRTRHKFDGCDAELRASRPDLRIVHLRSQRDTDAWLASLER
ncbi:MAG: AAA family ATPase [Protaetiibacter sp.]